MYQSSRMILTKIEEVEKAIVGKKNLSELDGNIILTLRVAREQILHLESLRVAEEDDWK